MRMANDKTSPAPRHDVLEEAFDRLERAVPDRVTRAIRWMRKPQARAALLLPSPRDGGITFSQRSRKAGGATPRK